MSLRERLICALAFFGAFGFALAQPLFDLIGGEPVFLQQHAVGLRQLILLVAMSWFVPGIVLGAIVLILGAVSRRLTLAVYGLSFATLAALTILPALRSLQPWLAAGIAAFLGLGSAFALLRWPRLRGFAALSALAPLVFSAFFLARPGVRTVLWPTIEEGQSRPIELGEMRDLIVVVLDELPLTHLLRDEELLDEERFPHLSSLASDGIWFRNALSVSAYTQHAVPAILCGQLNGEPPTRALYPHNLFTLLQHDYRVVGSESLSDLCPDELERLDPLSRAHRWDLLLSDCAILWAHRVLPSDWARKLPQIDAQWTGFGAAQSLGEGRPAKFRNWLRRLQPGFKPLLGAIHQVFPHNPYNYYPDTRRYSDRSEEPFKYRGRWLDDPLAAEQAWMRSLLQAQAADHLIGELVAHLKDKNLYDRSVIAVVADHGVSFRGGDFARRLSDANRSDILGIPFFLKLPDQRRAGEVDRRLLSTLDVLPTIAEAAGFALPWEVEGRSMLRPDSEARASVPFVDADDGDRRLDFGLEELSGQAETLRRKQELLEHGEYALTRSRAIAGRPLDEFELDGDSMHALRLARSRFGAEFRGELLAAAPLESAVEIAAVVRDSIAALTRTIWEDPERRGGEFWLLLPPGRVGPVRWFEVTAGGALRGLGQSGHERSLLGRRLASEEVAGVSASGFHASFARDGERHRWTGPSASLLVPLAEGERAHSLRIDVAENRGSEWELLVGGTRLYRGSELGMMEFELGGRSGDLQIELRSLDGEDPGLRVRGLWIFD